MSHGAQPSGEVKDNMISTQRNIFSKRIDSFEMYCFHLTYILTSPYYAPCFQAKSVAQRFQEIVALVFGTPLNPREYWLFALNQRIML